MEGPPVGGPSSWDPAPPSAFTGPPPVSPLPDLPPPGPNGQNGRGEDAPLPLEPLDHVNVRTARLSEMIAFYTEVLGLRPGDRPDFEINGAWLYCGAHAAVHLVAVAETPRIGAPSIEHFAFRATGLADFLAHLQAMDVAYRISIVPGLGLRQVNVHDPDGNHIEVAFAADEQADLANYPRA